MGHLITDAAPISGKDLHDAEVCFAQPERARLMYSAFLGYGITIGS